MHLEYVSVSVADADDETASLLAADADAYGEPSLFARAVANNPASYYRVTAVSYRGWSAEVMSTAGFS